VGLHECKSADNENAAAARDESRHAGLDKRERAQLRTKLYARLRELESGIEKAEARLGEIHALQADPDAYANGLVTPEISAEGHSLEQNLPAMVAEWENVGTEIEALKS